MMMIVVVLHRPCASHLCVRDVASVLAPHRRAARGAGAMARDGPDAEERTADVCASCIPSLRCTEAVCVEVASPHVG